jgi:hypothetical protein
MSHDLIEVGMQADRRRAELHPERMVTYSIERGHSVDLREGELLPPESLAVRPMWQPGMTGVEYLGFVARCRLELPAQHIEIDWRGAGLKVAQLALRFGANDFGDAAGNEEDIRRIIRDAGFLPKRRDAHYVFVCID